MRGLIRRATGWAVSRIDARLVVLLGLLSLTGLALAHGVSDDDKAFIEGSSGLNLIPYIYLGAKHMVTGYDHLLFLVGVIFFLYRMKDVGKYVTLFAIGHSTTLLLGVIGNIHANPYLVDAVIGLSVVYKALDNLGALRRVLGFQPNPKAAVLVFGFCHGFGLATKLQELSLSKEGMVPNIVAFNVGVEIGQLLALSLILLVMNIWRRSASFERTAVAANAALMAAGFVLIGFQLTQFFVPIGA
ncbi:HupE/UreJ family protein [Caballeronia sp. J97]|uniref:HupE/UreJ family protein n=1 Tax=Caballeronia sp. J97 TaxID=2805429 RepID=UPI002AAFE6D3|nr:HupE/UreJ family protein [Caballeronia sp. J97]